MFKMTNMKVFKGNEKYLKAGSIIAKNEKEATLSEV